MRERLYNWKILARMSLVTCLLFFSSPAGAQSAIELRVKAAFVYNFAKFTTWPAEVPPGNPFVIGCYGDGAFMEVLTATVAGKSLEGHPIAVKMIGSAEDLSGCQILFVGNGQAHRAATLLRTATTAHVLTVGVSDDFASKGGMIQFVVVNNGVKFVINQQEAEVAGLKISSKLLELALKGRLGGG